MAEQKKMVETITSMDGLRQMVHRRGAQGRPWPIFQRQGCTIIRPYGSIWENIRDILDGMFKETGHENVMMPLLIPESLLQKEKDHGGLC